MSPANQIHDRSRWKLGKEIGHGHDAHHTQGLKHSSNRGGKGPIVQKGVGDTARKGSGPEAGPAVKEAR